LRERPFLLDKTAASAGRAATEVALVHGGRAIGPAALVGAPASDAVEAVRPAAL
jgi:hypothetical protein